MSETSGPLAGRIVLYTGAGRGIGKACASYIASLGATIVINDLDADAATDSAVDLVRAGFEAIAMPCDVSDWAAVDTMISAIVDRYGHLDGLVNNAALFTMADLAASSAQLWETTIRANIIGVAACGQRAAAQMAQQGSGSIVNITSGAQCGIPGMSVYGATKAAVASMTYTWAMELKTSGVRVNAVSPRGDTRMAAHGHAYTREQQGIDLPPEPPPASNAPAIAFLLSDRASGITGQIVRVDGKSLGLMSHPAVSVPMLNRTSWDLDSVADTFDATLRSRLYPAGVSGLDGATVVPVGAPGWVVQSAG